MTVFGSGAGSPDPLIGIGDDLRAARGFHRMSRPSSARDARVVVRSDQQDRQDRQVHRDTGTPGHGSPARHGVLALTSFLVAPVPMVYLHLTQDAGYDAVRHPVSDYVFARYGMVLFAVSALALVVGTVALLRGLIAVGLPRDGRVRALFGTWCGGLVVAALFPTDPAATPTSVSGLVHRYAGAALFASLPWAGLLLARHLKRPPAPPGAGNPVHVLALASVVCSVVFLLTHLSDVAPDLAFAQFAAGFRGLAERVLLVVDLALLLALTGVLRRMAGTAGHRSPGRVVVGGPTGPEGRLA